MHTKTIRYTLGVKVRTLILLEESFLRLLYTVDEEERVDEAGLRRVVDHVIAAGVHGILALGSNGEFFGQDTNEQKRVVAITIDQARDRVPVYMGLRA
jgi:4-hydroxy-tetrahydrodipicolinate synthase